MGTLKPDLRQVEARLTWECGASANSFAPTTAGKENRDAQTKRFLAH